MKWRSSPARLPLLGLVTLGLVAGCSSGTPEPGGAGGPSSSSGSGASGSGGSSSTGGGASSSGGPSSGSSGSGGGGASGSGSGGASSSGASGSGSSGGSSSGASGSGSGSSGAISDAGADASAEEAWLQPQNTARAAVGEAPLVWNPIAAQVALAWASMCNWGHNPSAGSEYDSMGGTGDLGENVASGAPTETVAAAVASWVAEEASYDHTTNTCATNQVCGHYTQVVWSSTKSVGCAKVHCTTGSPFGTQYPNWDFGVCDYSPPGNYVGQAPY